MDNSFLRLKSDMTEAFSLDGSPVIDLTYVGQVHLKPGEVYLQITNSDVPLNISSYDVHLVDSCGNVLYDITTDVATTNFLDSNGIAQFVWEFYNRHDTGFEPVAIRFTETSNGDMFWTNLFVSTESNLNYTSRIDYKNNGFHYGTQYNNADYYQSIRLTAYYNNKINESERAEYHQISTDVTVSQRNINKQKERFILHEFDEFTAIRLEALSSSSEIYVNNKRYYNTTPIEYPDREGDSNMFEGDWVLNPTNDVFDFTLQLFAPLEYVSLRPNGIYLTGTTFNEMYITFNRGISVLSGTIEVYNSENDIKASFDESDVSISGNIVTVNTAGSALATGLDNETYHVNVSAGLFIDSIGQLNEAIIDNTTWKFTLQDADFLNTDFLGTDFFVGTP